MSRLLPGLERIAQDLRYAIRTLRKSPGFTLLAIGALALGIGATTAIFTVVESVLLRPMPFPDPDRLVMIWEPMPRSDRRNVANMANFLAWKERSRSFEAMATWHQIPMNLLGGAEPLQVTGTATTADLFRAIRAAPLLGRTFASGEDGPSAPRVAVLTYGLWRRHFGGDEGVLGRRVSINGSHHEIIGVMPPDFAFPNRRGELFVPLRVGRGEGRNFSTVARLAPEVSLRAAQAEMTAIAAQTAEERPDVNAGWSATVVPLHEQTVGQIRPLLLVLLASVGFVLLIACANVANLLLMRAAGRTREMNVRLALGASHGRLIQQLLTESLLLAAIGGLLGIGLAYWSVQTLVTTLPTSFPLPRASEIQVDTTVLFFTMAVSLVAGVLFGLTPALQFRRVNLTPALQQSSRTVASGNRLRRALVVAEVALAVLLVTGAGLMIRSFVSLNSVEPGFRAENLLTLKMMLLPVRDRSLHAQLVNDILDRTRALPQVVSASSIHSLPMSGNSGTWYYRADRPEPPPESKFGGDVSIISPGYFQTMGIPLLQGRDFNARDRIGSPHVAIINQTTARLKYPGEDPSGKRLKVSWNDAREVEIVGVAADIRHSQLHTKSDPCLFLPNGQQPFPQASLVVRTAGDPLALAAAVREQIRRADPDQGIAEIRTMDQLVSESIARPRVQMLLSALFGLIALVLACIGIYGVISYSVAQRTREIGIRMALGADRGKVLRGVLQGGMGLTGVGLSIGLAGAIPLTRYLEKLLYEVKPTDPIVLASVITVLLVVAVAACYFPARRAAGVDPMIALREE